VKVGIAGLGFMGITHASALSKLAGVQLGAICSNSDKVLVGDFSGVGGNLDRGPVHLDLSNVNKYKNWRDMLADPSIDAVDLCLPTDLHCEIATAALQAGKHVLCEKPMALTPDDCRSMLQAAAKSKRVLMIAQVLRFWPEYQVLRQFITEGKYGRILSATFVRRAGLPNWSQWLTNELRSGGAVLDLLVHDIDQILLNFGLPERVAAKSIGEPDTLSATFLYPKGGPEVRLQGGWFPTGTAFSMSFQVRAERAEMELTADGLLLSDVKGTRTKVEVPALDAYEAELQYFFECCRTGQAPALCMPEESANAVNVALLLKQSRMAGGEQLQCLV
jgi:predicted dehydrogenase